MQPDRETVTEAVPARERATTSYAAETRTLARELMRRVKEAQKYAKRIDRLSGNTMPSYASLLPNESKPLGLTESLDQIIQRLNREFFAEANKKSS